ncbi:MAG: hypothetical protein ACO1RT_13800, partial [Planctomycetaceae bacterium]
MKMLRFDPSGAIHPEYGVTGEQLKALYPRLIALRQELVEAAPASPLEDCAGTASTSSCRSAIRRG